MRRELPVVTIVGRPNVGKSALFNRLIGRRKSIVADQPGVTRDRIYSECEWNGTTFLLADTGGIDPQDPDILRRQVFEQANRAMEESALLLLVVDGQLGIHALDEEVASLLRSSAKPVILVVNKTESPKDEADHYQFYALGLGDPVAISAIHGTNTGDLLDAVVAHVQSDAPPPDHDDISIALVGRPNVGKSSLLNRILGEERSLVHDEAGTTRDTVDTFLDFEGNSICLLDTAGLRRKGKVTDEVEYYSSVRAMDTIKRAHVGILVLDAQESVVAQDKRIAGQLQEAGLASLVLINKWDLVADKGTGQQLERWKQDFAEMLSRELDFISYAPMLYVSAKTGHGCEQILPAALEVHQEWSRRVPTPVLNQVVHEAVALRPPPSYKGDSLKVFYVSQRRSGPPTFLLKVNSPKLVHFSYQRYLENQIRQAFGFVGAPIVLKFVR
ncbi:MAG: ribosome biogenesis GTPase Der [Vulcanimicrobiota bacterium]